MQHFFDSFFTCNRFVWIKTSKSKLCHFNKHDQDAFLLSFTFFLHKYTKKNLKIKWDSMQDNNNRHLLSVYGTCAYKNEICNDRSFSTLSQIANQIKNRRNKHWNKILLKKAKHENSKNRIDVKQKWECGTIIFCCGYFSCEMVHVYIIRFGFCSLFYDFQ